MKTRTFTNFDCLMINSYINHTKQTKETLAVKYECSIKKIEGALDRVILMNIKRRKADNTVMRIKNRFSEHVEGMGLPDSIDIDHQGYSDIC